MESDIFQCIANDNNEKDINRNSLSSIYKLPNEILIYIFSLLDAESAFLASQVCQRWNQLLQTSLIWENIKFVICMKNYERMADSILPFVGEKVRIVKLQYFKLYCYVRKPLTENCVNINHLEIAISQIDQCIFKDLVCWPHLKILSFRNSLINLDKNDPNHNNVYDLPFNKLHDLQVLVLSNFALNSDSLNSMLLCNNLISINIEKMKNIPTVFLEKLIQSKREIIESLNVYGDTLNEDVMRCIGLCSSLEVLHIQTCKNLFDTSLTYINNLSNLRSLKLRHGYFSANALLAFFTRAKFMNLEYLSLSRCMHITMQVVLAIKSSAPNLKELSFYLCPFVMAENFDRSELEKIFHIPLLLD